MSCTRRAGPSRTTSSERLWCCCLDLLQLRLQPRWIDAMYDGCTDVSGGQRSGASQGRSFAPYAPTNFVQFRMKRSVPSRDLGSRLRLHRKPMPSHSCTAWCTCRLAAAAETIAGSDWQPFAYHQETERLRPRHRRVHAASVVKHCYRSTGIVSSGTDVSRSGGPS